MAFHFFKHPISLKTKKEDELFTITAKNENDFERFLAGLGLTTVKHGFTSIRVVQTLEE